MARLSSDDRFAIEDLLTRYGWLIDHGRGSDCADLFTEDGRLAFLGEDLAGREAIRSALAARSGVGGRVVRHIWSDLVIERADGASIWLATTAITFVAPADQPWAKQMMVGVTKDELCRSPEGNWLFRSRQLSDIMPFGSPA